MSTQRLTAIMWKDTNTKNI